MDLYGDANVRQVLFSIGFAALLSMGMMAVSYEASEPSTIGTEPNQIGNDASQADTSSQMSKESADNQRIAYEAPETNPFNKISLKIAIIGSIFAVALLVGEALHRKKKNERAGVSLR